MPNVRVHNLSVSLDGYVAGPDQGIDHPLGRGGERLHEWAFATRAFGHPTGTDGLDEALASEGDVGFGATIMGRNMFGPIRGPWGDADWAGWWGADPPYHHPVFVLTHHPRPSITMQGGTTFHFVDAGIGAALERAADAACGRDVRIGGGAAAIQQYLRAGLIDEMHLVIVPTLLGGGERLFDERNGPPAGYACELVGATSVAHVRLSRS